MVQLDVLDAYLARFELRKKGLSHVFLAKNGRNRPESRGKAPKHPSQSDLRIGGHKINHIAIVIERAVEVYVAKRYDPVKLRVRRELTRAEAKLAKAEQALAEERERRHGSSRTATDEDEQYMRELVENVRQAHEALDEADEKTWCSLSKERVKKIRAATFLSLTFGALASLSGVRVLGQFLPMENGKLTGEFAESALQLGVFRTTDTLLTALVLAGGADGIHKMISSFKSFRSSA